MKRNWFWWLLAALLIAALLSPLASSHPDGLERVAEDKEFLEKGYSVLRSPIPDYLFPGVEHEGLATALAGIIGTVLTFGVMVGIGRLVLPRSRSQKS